MGTEEEMSEESLSVFKAKLAGETMYVAAAFMADVRQVIARDSPWDDGDEEIEIAEVSDHDVESTLIFDEDGQHTLSLAEMLRDNRSPHVMASSCW